MPRIKLDMPEQFAFATDIPVRIGDINYGGHLGNDAVLAIAHEARIQFLRSMDYSEQDVAGAGLIMLDAVVVYRSEAFYGDVLHVEMVLADPQTTGCDILYLMSNLATRKEVARVKTGMAFFDYARHKVVPMPEAFRTRMG